ncbi:uncharacterized protein EAE97_011696 [Botrytis byssoidea]|uniref:Uncharacterized protein n=1 Tax=Botrytis byssoidea TaxID=139641 RepID=A0A9P5I070_9HELO|nr:uncharacterized protein EAE97_011696 [Botrytis byssoidea]KAF7919364.1 hypothetical protein EAE97_011696 [Botrytis byssoidea]
MEERRGEIWRKKKCQEVEVEEEMKKWWKLGLGIPSEILDDEEGYDIGGYNKGYKGLGYDLEGWEPEPKDLKVTFSKQSFPDGPQEREQRYLEAKRWKRLVQPLQHEILAIH